MLVLFYHGYKQNEMATFKQKFCVRQSGCKIYWQLISPHSPAYTKEGQDVWWLDGLLIVAWVINWSSQRAQFISGRKVA